MRAHLDTARRLYGELVRGRTRVRVVRESSDIRQAPANFILSPYRSGTTLLRYCLDSHPQLAVPPETDFLAPLGTLLQDEASVTGFSDLGYEYDDVVDRLARFGRSFLDVYAAGRGAESWCDKSPRYAEDPDNIYKLFPGARFVIMHRHPLDQVHSFTKGGTYVHALFEGAAPGDDVILRSAEYWAATTHKLQRFAQSHVEQALTMTYEELCAEPEQTLKGVLHHLDLRWSPEVLQYHRHDHDIGREAGRVVGTVGFMPTSGKWLAWRPELVDRVWESVASTATELGYAR